tara:strand:+ start:3391 stop:3615 length:225 start_codon:yes stop_codon:yes gene_type:complete
LELDTQEVKASGDLATAYGKYILTLSPNETLPIPKMEDKGNFWKKIDGEWEVVWDAPITELPLPTQVSDSAMIE